ncbi:glycosyltransferase [Flavobacterium sp.]|jgi:glycosyltransferase involved in cell wall biosynthesis|uniref:glycosyltransferase n=1 Tax=Flavobacterium sp. TaxID=239 RepID=UPI0037C0FA5B
MKKALVIDWLDKFTGSERVIASLDKIFAFDNVYTLISVMNEEDIKKTLPKHKGKIEQTKLKYFGSFFRYLFFIFHHLIGLIKIDKNIELIISSSHSVAKGVKKSSKQLHICFFQAPNFNYIWDHYNLFFGKLKYIIHPLIILLRRIDFKQAQRPDYIVANSNYVKNWIREKYNRDSIVIYPPVDLNSFQLNTVKEDYYIAIGRIATIKRFDIIIEAFNKNKKKLIIIGDGEQFEKMKEMASSNIEFKGFLESIEINKYVSKAKAFIQVGIEGFGIAPIEAQACGTPIIAYGKGGVLETVVDKLTGLFFDEQSVNSLLQAIEKFETMKFNPVLIRDNALKFSTEKFEEEVKNFVFDKYQIFKENQKLNIN